MELRTKQKTDNAPEIIIYSLNFPRFLRMMDADQKAEAIDCLTNAVKALRGAGVKVEFHIEEDKGHDMPSPKTLEAYYDCLKRMLAK